MPQAAKKTRRKGKRGGNSGPFKPVPDLAEIVNKPYLTIEEAALYIGVSDATIRRWIERGLLKRSKLNHAKSGRVLISKERLHEVMTSLENEEED
jgi:excisionase family DNA binding protein